MASEIAPRDPNRHVAIQGTNPITGETVNIFGDPITGELYVKGSAITPIDPTANSLITLSQTDNTPASTKTLTKTVDGVTYTRTLSYNAAGQFLQASYWT